MDIRSPGGEYNNLLHGFGLHPDHGVLREVLILELVLGAYTQSSEAPPPFPGNGVDKLPVGVRLDGLGNESILRRFPFLFICSLSSLLPSP